MKVDNFRTNDFRDMVNHIASEKGYDKQKYHRLKFNIKSNGDIKPLRINGIDDNYIAYFRKEVEDGDTIHSIPVGITYNEYISFNRDITLSKIVGDEIKIKDNRKSQKEPNFIPVVGMILRGSSYSTSKIVTITKVTNKQFKYKYSGGSGTEYIARLKKDGNWEYGSGCNNSRLYNDVNEFDFRAELKQMEYDSMNR